MTEAEPTTWSLLDDMGNTLHNLDGTIRILGHMAGSGFEVGADELFQVRYRLSDLHQTLEGQLQCVQDCLKAERAAQNDNATE